MSKKNVGNNDSSDCEILVNICNNISIITLILIQFNSIPIYLHANLTAQGQLQS
jgi:hypothetical protein